jgi:hypothetical protein
MVELVTVDCPSCGLLFGVTRGFERGRRETGESFTCPNACDLFWPVEDVGGRRVEPKPIAQSHDEAGE